LKHAGHAPSLLAQAVSSFGESGRFHILCDVLDGRPGGYYDGPNLQDVIIHFLGDAS
jgi:hypothetical protein